MADTESPRRVFYGIDRGETPDETAIAFARKTEGGTVEVLATLCGPAAHFVALALSALERMVRNCSACGGDGWWVHDGRRMSCAGCEEARALIGKPAVLVLPLPLEAAERLVDVVFDGPPGPESGRFVEVEDMQGKSVKVGEWMYRGNGMWALRLPLARSTEAKP